MEFENKKNTIYIDNNQNIIDYREILEKYSSHWKIFLMSIFITIVLAFAYIRYTPYEYLVTTTILIDDSDSGGLTSELSAFQDIDVLRSKKKSIINEIGVLKSRTLIANVIKQLNLNVTYYSQGKVNNSEIYKEQVPFKINFFIKDSILYNLDTTLKIKAISKTKIILINEDDQSIRQDLFGKNILTSFGELNITPIDPGNINVGETLIVKFTPLAKVVNDYRKKIIIEPEDTKSSLLILSLVDPVKQKAIDILDNMVRNYNNDAITYKDLITKNTDKFINDRISKISDDLSTVDKGVEEFKTLNKLTDMEFETNLVLESNSKLGNRIVDLTSQIRLIDYVSEYIENNKSDLIPTNLGLKDESTNQSTLVYNKLLMERNRIILNSSTKNPTVINLDAQIESIRNSIEQSLTNFRSSLHFALREAKIQESKLNEKRILAPMQEREFQDIKRKQQIVETLYLYLLQKREENAISLGLPVPNAIIIDKANGSDRPVAPKKIIIYIAAILLGLLVPFFIITVLAFFDNKVHTIEDLKKFAESPILGDIPHSKSKEKVVITDKERSNIAESFRLVRTNLNFMLSNSSAGAKAIFITSTIGNEGKTFISINLASSLVSINKKVLLICADLRKPKVSEYLNIKSTIGLSHYLVDSKLDISDIIIPVEKTNFDIIESGEIPPNPSELLVNGRFEEVMAFARENYEYVIVDTPPVNLITDTLLISHLADSFIYVIRANYLDKKLLSTQKEMSRNKRLPNVALLLNDTDDVKRGYRYGYGEEKTSRSWWK